MHCNHRSYEFGVGGGRGRKPANRGIRNSETGRIVYQHCEQKWM